MAQDRGFSSTVRSQVSCKDRYTHPKWFLRFCTWTPRKTLYYRLPRKLRLGRSDLLSPASTMGASAAGTRLPPSLRLSGKRIRRERYQIFRSCPPVRGDWRRRRARVGVPSTRACAARRLEHLFHCTSRLPIII